MKTNTGRKNREGRTVWAGLRGGWFVETSPGRRKYVKEHETVLGPPPETPESIALARVMPRNVLEHVARRHPVAAAKMAVAGSADARAVATAQRARALDVARAWRAKTDGPKTCIRVALNDVMKTRAMKIDDLQASERALLDAGFKVPRRVRYPGSYLVEKTYRKCGTTVVVAKGGPWSNGLIVVRGRRRDGRVRYYFEIVNRGQPRLSEWMLDSHVDLSPAAKAYVREVVPYIW